MGRKLSEDALKIDPHYPEAHASIGLSHLVEAMGAWGEHPASCAMKTVTALKTALTMDDKNPLALAGMGLSQIAMRQYEDGLSSARQGYLLAPNSTEVVSLYALARVYCGEYDEAQNMLLDAMRCFPKYPAWYPAVLSALNLIKQDNDLALEKAKEGADIAPNFMLSYIVLAMAHQECGDHKQAGEAVQNILRISPKFTIQIFELTQPFKEKAVREQFSSLLKDAGLPE
jgi:tetratricopeptide (TPR) repeat protein